MVWAVSMNNTTGQLVAKTNVTTQSLTVTGNQTNSGNLVFLPGTSAITLPNAGLHSYSVGTGFLAFMDGSAADTGYVSLEGFKLTSGGFAGTVQGKAASYNAGTADSTILMGATGQTVTLPTAVSDAGRADGRIYTVKLVSSGSCTVTNVNGSQTIDGSLSYLISGQYSYATFQSDGTNWQVIDTCQPSTANIGTLTVTNKLSPSAIQYRAGTTNIASLATSQAVTFSSFFPSTVGTNYRVGIAFDSTLASAVSAAATSKTTNGFTITLSAGITGGVNVDWTALPDN